MARKQRRKAPPISPEVRELARYDGGDVERAKRLAKLMESLNHDEKLYTLAFMDGVRAAEMLHRPDIHLTDALLFAMVDIATADSARSIRGKAAPSAMPWWL